MVQQSKYNNYDVKDLETLATTERPVAGQSLTDNPEQQYPWEGPTKFTETQPAIEAIFTEITENEAYFAILDLVKNKLPIGDIAQVILYDGFTKGMWNPDLMLLLVEPVMYMVLALSERAGLQDVKIYSEQDQEPSSQEEQVKSLNKAMEVMQKTIVPKIAKKSIPISIAEKIEEFVPPKSPSLLEATKQEEIENISRENLLDKGARA